MGEVFNPFNKEFEKVTAEDLEILKSVAEGWNVEYKKEKLNGKSIAKSISSFANSHGGIYFIGIEANPQNNCASNILGVDNSPDIIRDSVSGNLQPFPFFKTYTISLSNGKRILMAVVPEGENPPYINSDGKIYRRQEAASDPIPEINRHSIDELYRKAEKYADELEEFRDFDLSFCKGEDSVPYLEIFINTKPFKHFSIEKFFDDENLKKILDCFNGNFNVEEQISDTKTGFSGNIKFDSLNTYNDSISLRFLENHDLAYNGITLIIDIFGNLKLLIPLNEKYYLSETLAKEYSEVLNRSKNDSVASIGFLDARQIVGAIFGLIAKYVSYLDEKKYKESIEVKIRLRNCYRKTIYIESSRFIEHVKQFGIPICMKSEQYFPFFPITLKMDEIKSNPITRCLIIFSHIANALGIPSIIAVTSVIEEIQNNPQQTAQ